MIWCSVNGAAKWAVQAGKQPGEVVVIGDRRPYLTALMVLIVPAAFSLADGVEKRLGPKLRRSLLTFEPEHAHADREATEREGFQPAE